MPEWTEHLRPRLATLRLSPGREAEIVEELSQHLDQRHEELRAGGRTDAQARRLAIEELLEPHTLAERMRTLRQANTPPPIVPGVPRRALLADVWDDLRYAVRMLRKQPGLAGAAILTLALGIGANSAIFALVDAVLLRPLPLRDPERLVIVWERSATTPHDSVAPLNMLDWNSRSGSFEQIAGFVPYVGGMVLAGADGIPETVSRQWVTAGFFDVLGIKPILGRGFLSADDVQRVNVAALSEGFWRTRFGADPSIVGRSVRLDGASYRIVGVFPDQIQVFGRTGIWALRPIMGAPPEARSAYSFEAIGRLKPGVTPAAADADLSAVASALAREFPATNRGRGVSIEPAGDAVIGSELRRTSMLFLGVVAFVLAICCANVANLLVARATARARELAIRAALGASRSRVIRQLLTESLVLSLLGCVGGLGIGAAIVKGAPRVLPTDLLPAAITLAIDTRVLVFCLAAALLVGVLFGLLPAWQASRVASAPTLASEGRSLTAASGGIHRALVAGEVATAVVLLFGAGLLLRTVLAVEGVDRGYRARHVLTMIVDPLGSRYPTNASRMQFYDALESEIRALPGVGDVAWASTLPLGPSYFGRAFIAVAGDSPAADGQRPTADYQIISPTYFRALDLPVMTGRAFDARDTNDGVPVCMVNEAFVRRHLAGRRPVGERIAIQSTDATGPPVVREIVGVARQVKGRPDETEDFVQIYVPLAQEAVDDIFVAIRPRSAGAPVPASSVRAAIARIDPLTSVRSVMTLEEVASEAAARHRFRAELVVAFAGLALLLAMVGLSGILTHSVQQRVREFGVRRALGATTADLLRVVLASAARVIGAGLVIGLALSVAFGRLVATMLVGVRPLDPLTAVSVILLLGVTAGLAVAGPVVRAARVDPAAALRID